MLKHFQIKIILFFLLIGFLAFCIGYFSEIPKSYQAQKILYQKYEIETSYFDLFRFLFVNNLKVGFMIAIFGFITGGFAAIVIFSWNSYAFGLLVSGIFLHFTNPLAVIAHHVVPHAVAEILAFCLFGCIGVKGFSFIKDVIRNSEISIEQVPKIKMFFLPVLLLLIAALLETFLSS